MVSRKDLFRLVEHLFQGQIFYVIDARQTVNIHIEDENKEYHGTILPSMGNIKTTICYIFSKFKVHPWGSYTKYD